MVRKTYLFVLTLSLITLWQSCTTEKNTWLTRKFHTTCAHYNGYFWGKLSYDEGLDKLFTTHKEDYADILSVYTYAENTEVQSIFPQMDRTIKKCQTMIENHTITDKAKHEIPDACKYTKYCYLLMAEANLYKNEYITSIDELDYTSREYKKTDVKYEAMIWQIRAFNQMGAVSKSEELIDYLKSNTSIPKKLLPEMDAAIADYYERIGQYEDVSKWLKKAVATEKKKKVRARYYFILAQITSRQGDNEKAYALYGKCLNSNPVPELEFEATIYRAMLFMGGDKENQKVKKELNKMLKPTKYLDDRDQIYYVLAQIAMKETDTVQAVQYLNKSVRASTTNARQKAVSYLQLADLNFYWEEYVLSKKYFDSTLTSLPKNFKGRDSIVAKKENLQKLVNYLDIISFQDSVLKLSKLSKKDLNSYVDSLIAKEKQDEADKKKKELDATLNAQNNGANSQPVQETANGKWYFYNPGAMQQGVTEFTQKWGNRPLEDDWRRSKKIAVANKVGQEENAGKGDSSKTVTKKIVKDSLKDKFSRAHYLKNIPQGDLAIKKATDSLIDAYYNAGAIYKEYLRNYRRSSADFETLLSRFPDNKYKLLVYYELYRIYKDLPNEERMNYYKDLLLNQYPNSQYAMLIKDPEKYARDKEASKQEINRLYTATMQSYKMQNYIQVMGDCQQADSLFPKNDLTPKFAFLKAMAVGATQGIDAYKNELTRVTVLYPKDSVKLLAQTILNYLNRKPEPVIKKDSDVIKYSNAADSMYLWILLVDAKEATKMSNIVAKLTDMNSKTFSQDNLKTDQIFLNTNQLMVVMKTFTSIDKAKNYYQFLNADGDIFSGLSPASYQTFYVSQHNFLIMFRHKKADEYLQFFREKLI